MRPTSMSSDSSALSGFSSLHISLRHLHRTTSKSSFERFFSKAFNFSTASGISKQGSTSESIAEDLDSDNLAWVGLGKHHSRTSHTSERTSTPSIDWYLAEDLEDDNMAWGRPKKD